MSVLDISMVRMGDLFHCFYILKLSPVDSLDCIEFSDDDFVIFFSDILFVDMDIAVRISFRILLIFLTFYFLSFAIGGNLQIGENLSPQQWSFIPFMANFIALASCQCFWDICFNFDDISFFIFVHIFIHDCFFSVVVDDIHLVFMNVSLFISGDLEYVGFNLQNIPWVIFNQIIIHSFAVSIPILVLFLLMLM